MNENGFPNPHRLLAMGEAFASGFFEQPDACAMRRWSRAVRRRFENETAPPYRGELLYPSGIIPDRATPRVLAGCYSYTWQFNPTLLKKKLDGTQGEDKKTLQAVDSHMNDLCSRLNVTETPHVIGGNGYTHSVPNYGRVVREGFDRYARRIADNLHAAQSRGDTGQVDFYLGLQDVLAGIGQWHRHLLDVLETSDDPAAKRIAEAYKRVPFAPAETFFEALVAYNFVYYLDDCDNPGRIDQELIGFYERDLADGRITHDEAVSLFRRFWISSDVNVGWSAAIGGTTPDGKPGYNELTLIALEAAHSLRRPNLQLHIRRDMPQEVWDAALDTLATGCGLPAIYNEEAFLDSLRAADLGIREEDLGWYNGGGCTETMIHGLSNVGSLDAGINLPLVLRESLDEYLPKASTYEKLLEGVKCDIAGTVKIIVDHVNRDQETKSRLRPQPMRSLLMDDCIDNGVEFNAGGARYNWSVVNIAGLANLIDSLAAIREVVYENEEITGSELLDILNANFDGHEEFRKRLERCPRFGNDNPGADDIAENVSAHVFNEFLRHVPWRGGKFLPSCLMFVTYADAGIDVGATPDGRFAGAPVADSAGPYQGRDTKGPTAMLKSVAAIPHSLAPGTLIVNVRFAKDMFATREGRKKLQDLFRTYFDMGGMQLQINVVDQEVLRDAIRHPEKHEDLIVRIGGYSEYFNALTPALKQTVLERTEHAA